MSEPIPILLVAVGGYGQTYVNALLDQPKPVAARIVGVVDPYAERCRRFAELQAAGIPVFQTVEAFFAARTAALTVISSPIHLHCPQTCAALEGGSPVLCEKPAGATIQEVRRMMAARDRSKRFVAIGYQWSFSPAVQALKADVMAGRFGRPKQLRTLVLWPRNEVYYGRNSWAGAQRGPRGEWILDSPANNATAHYLHNMLYVLGSRVDRSAVPVSVTAELYRANPITNFDTVAARVRTECGAEVLFYASHAIGTTRGPEFEFAFEHGVVRHEGRGQPLVAEFADGSRHAYGNPDGETTRKLWASVRAAQGEDTIVCGLEAASAQTLCINGMQESMPEIAPFPADLVSRQGDEGARFTVVAGLDAAMAAAYDAARLPAEMGAPWALSGREIDLRGYADFPRGPYPNAEA